MLYKQEFIYCYKKVISYLLFMYFSILSHSGQNSLLWGKNSIRTVKEDSCAIACSYGGKPNQTKNKTKCPTITDWSSLKYQHIL